MSERPVLGDDLAPAVPMDQVASRSGFDPRLRAHTRDDPYHGSLFDVSARAAWAGRELLHRELAAGKEIGAAHRFKDALAVLDDPVDVDPVERLLTRHRATVLRMLAAVNMWRTLTVPQMAAMVGHARWAGTEWPTAVSKAFAAGLLQVGELASVFRTDLPTLLRVDPDGDPHALLDRLDYADWLGVTSGQLWRGTTTPDRHNVLVAELALRIAQMCPGAGAVMGEMVGNHDLLLGVDDKRLSRRRADSVVVRKDGLRIAVEATANDRFGHKMANWVDALVADRSHSTVVLFVEAGRPGYSSVRTYNAIYQGMERAVSSSMPAMAARVLERMFLVRWVDWFPRPGQVTPDFAVLPATAYAGSGIGGQARWRRVDLLDPEQLPFDPDATPGGAMSVLENSRLLLGSPKVLTDRVRQPAPDVGAVIRAAAGFPTVPGADR